MKPKSIDEYINIFPEDVRNMLNTLRRIIKEEAPDAEESISYMMPAFKTYGYPLVYFAGFKDHISIFPTSSNLETSIKEVAKYRTGKGTLQFPLDKPLPMDLIRKIVQVRVKENLERKKK